LWCKRRILILISKEGGGATVQTRDDTPIANRAPEQKDCVVGLVRKARGDERGDDVQTQGFFKSGHGKAVEGVKNTVNLKGGKATREPRKKRPEMAKMFKPTGSETR